MAKNLTLLNGAIRLIESGPIEYVYGNNSNAQSGIGDWVTYADAAGANAIDGNGGTANITLTRNTSTPLRGVADFLLTKDAVNRQGEGASYDFSIDNADKAQKLYIGFDFDTSDANYADDDIRIQIYDVTNSVLIRCNGEDLKGGGGKHLAWFQSSADSTSYRLIFHVSSTNATAYDVYFDNIQVGPREVSYGGAMTDWKSYTPTFTGFGTVTVSEFLYRQVGSNVEISGSFTSGTTTAVKAQITLPLGLSVSSLVTTTKNAGIILNGFNSTSKGGAVLITGGDAFLNVGSGATFASTKVNASLTANGNTYSSAATMKVYATIPIQGWSSNSVQSEDIGNREVRVRGAGNSGAAITANTEAIDFTVVEDTTASWSQVGVHGKDTFTVPETANYIISGTVATTGANTSNIYAYIDGTQNIILSKNIGVSSAQRSFSGTISLIKGQTLSVRSSLTFTLSNSSILHNIHIQKLAQPQTLLETETVAARYTSNSGQSITTTIGVIEYEDIDFDTHNAYNISTGEYTVPIQGKYDVRAFFGGQAVTLYIAYIYVNGVDVARQYSDSPDEQVSGSISSVLNLNKGDVITIRGYAGSATALYATAQRNVFSIARIK